MKTRIAWIAVLCMAWLAAPAWSQERAWSEGAVVNVSSIKIEDGQFENYMTWLQGNWKRMMEESKKAGYVLDYNVYSASAHNPNEPDLYLVVTYPNMAALDGMNEKMEPILKKVMNQTPHQADEASGKRVVRRKVLGEELLREIKLK